MLTTDYIMRQVQALIRALIKLFFGMDVSEGQEETILEPEEKSGYLKLRDMADCGEINEAENLLFEKLEAGETGNGLFKEVILFYAHLNDMPEEVLLAQGYSRREIAEGLRDASDFMGCGELTQLFLDD